LGRPLDYKRVDCLRLIAFCLKALGHRKPTKGVRRYSSHIGALRAMKASGFASLPDAVAAYGLQPIAPAQALPADIVAYEGEGFGGYALGIALGQGRMLAIAPEPHLIVDIADIGVASHAWRAI